MAQSSRVPASCIASRPDLVTVCVNTFRTTSSCVPRPRIRSISKQGTAVYETPGRLKLDGIQCVEVHRFRLNLASDLRCPVGVCVQWRLMRLKPSCDFYQIENIAVWLLIYSTEYHGSPSCSSSRSALNCTRELYSDDDIQPPLGYGTLSLPRRGHNNVHGRVR